MHEQSVADITGLLRELAPAMPAEQLGALAAAVRTYRTDQSTAHQLQAKILEVYRDADPATRRKIDAAVGKGTATAAVGARYVPPAERARTPRRPPAAPARGGPPATPSQSDSAAHRKVLTDRAARQRELDAFYADPAYQQDLAGTPDDKLDVGYLKERRRLFGKRGLPR